jgi:hypothetical protein
MTNHQVSSSPGTKSLEDGTAKTPSQAAAHATRAAARAAAEEAQAVPARPWFRKKRFALPSAVVLLLGVLTVTTGGSDSAIFKAVTNAAQPTKANPANATAAVATIGESVRDGTFSFAVASVQPASKSFTDRFGVAQKAQGVFVTVRMNVTNIGYEARALTATDLFLVDTQGKRFATSPAILTLGGAEKVFLHKIDPGHTVNNAPVLFDLVPGTVIATLELHDSMSSTGVKVKLR